MILTNQDSCFWTNQTVKFCLDRNGPIRNWGGNFFYKSGPPVWLHEAPFQFPQETVSPVCKLFIWLKFLFFPHPNLGRLLTLHWWQRTFVGSMNFSSTAADQGLLIATILQASAIHLPNFYFLTKCSQLGTPSPHCLIPMQMCDETGSDLPGSSKLYKGV